jgi:hypothetical protein
MGRRKQKRVTHGGSFVVGVLWLFLSYLSNWHMLQLHLDFFASVTPGLFDERVFLGGKATDPKGFGSAVLVWFVGIDNAWW